MPVSSVQAIGDGYLQANGKRYVTETFTLTHGDPIKHLYLAPGAWGQAEWDAKANDRIVRINDRLAEQEFDELLADDAPASIALNHQTGAEFAERLREKYRQSSKEQCARIAWWIAERILQGQLTALQVRTAFGMDATQWATFRDNKLTPLHDAWAAALAAQGE